MGVSGEVAIEVVDNGENVWLRIYHERGLWGLGVYTWGGKMNFRHMEKDFIFAILKRFKAHRSPMVTQLLGKYEPPRDVEATLQSYIDETAYMH